MNAGIALMMVEIRQPEKRFGFQAA